MFVQVYVKTLDKEDHLVPVAFLDVPPYITTIRTFKNLLLLGDMVKSVWLAVFQVSRLAICMSKSFVLMQYFVQESPFKLDVIAKDLYDASIVSVDFLSSEGAITFGAADDRGDLRLLQFDPQRESRVPCRIIPTRPYWANRSIDERGRQAGSQNRIPHGTLSCKERNGRSKKNSRGSGGPADTNRIWLVPPVLDW